MVCGGEIRFIYPTTTGRAICHGEVAAVTRDSTLYDIQPTTNHGGKKFEGVVGDPSLEVARDHITVCSTVGGYSSNSNWTTVVPSDVSWSSIYYIVYRYSFIC